jgi:uncharacterized protein YajQ (UPF0234 family)
MRSELARLSIPSLTASFSDSGAFVGKRRMLASTPLVESCVVASEGGVFVASLFSFDVVSDYDEQELKNALDQTRRDVTSRYDLKDTKTEIELTDKEITIHTESEYSLLAVKDILETKFVRRNLSLKILDYQDDESASGGRVRQVVKLKKGIPDDLAKQISKRIRDEFKKVTPQIQGDALRVQAKSKDDLQAVMEALRGADYPVALQFTNYR